MMKLNRLENSVLKGICNLMDAKNAAVFAKQIHTMTIEKRRNTGGGFYSKLKVNEVTDRVCLDVMGGVYADIEGLKNPMVFLIYFTNGVSELLEGASVDGSTMGIDFDSAAFDLIR